MSLSNAFPSVSPSLNLNFVRNNRLDPRITYSRSTTATYVGSDGYIKTAAINAPRFEYDPVLLAPRGLLLEGPRTNLILYSEQFNNAAWTLASGTVTANNAIAPDGTLSADKLVASSTAVPYLDQAHSIVSGSTYTYSIFVESAEVTLISMLLYGTYFNSGGANPSASFNLSTGAITAQTTTGATITNFGNGWWRISITHTATASGSSNNQLLRFTNSPTAGQGLYAWGAQLEEAFFASSYIQTTSAQVTRAADDMEITGSNFTPWYNQANGAFVISTDTFKADNTANTTYSRIMNVSDESTDNRITLYFNTINTLSVISDSTTGFSTSSSETASKNIVHKIGLNFQSGNGLMTLNGVQAGTTQTDVKLQNTMNQITFFRFGTSSDEVNYGWGHIQYLLYYPEPLTLAQLQTLTK